MNKAWPYIVHQVFETNPFKTSQCEVSKGGLILLLIIEKKCHLVLYQAVMHDIKKESFIFLKYRLENIHFKLTGGNDGLQLCPENGLRKVY
jgi:hypothetical protein